MGLPKTLDVGRYHSWVVKTPLPDTLEATSFDKEGQLMSLRHKAYDVRAVQFHPESIMSFDDEVGLKLVRNAVKMLTDRT